jgi:hypothetical protein
MSKGLMTLIFGWAPLLLKTTPKFIILSNVLEWYKSDRFASEPHTALLKTPPNYAHKHVH